MNLLKSDFNHCEPGTFRLPALRRAFPGGVSHHFLMGRIDRLLFFLRWKSSKAEIKELLVQKMLKLNLPANVYGPLSGNQWKVSFAGSESAFLQYSLYIPANFLCMKGGKLPGLGGGKGNTGGKVPDGFDGWSVRFMFNKACTLCSYVYYPEMPGKYGEKILLEEKDYPFILPKGAWIKIGLYVKMNDIGKRNGIVQCFVDDRLMMHADNLLFRKTEALKVDHLLFSVFYGGADASYAPPGDCQLYFDDIIVNDKIE